MNDTHTPTVTQGYTVEKIDDEILLYSEANTQGVYLNDTAFAVYALCEEDLTIAQIIQLLEENYPEAKEQITDDVISILTTLQSDGVIEIKDVG